MQAQGSSGVHRVSEAVPTPGWSQRQDAWEVYWEIHRGPLAEHGERLQFLWVPSFSPSALLLWSPDQNALPLLCCQPAPLARS